MKNLNRPSVPRLPSPISYLPTPISRLLSQEWLLALVLVAGTLLAYRPVWHAGFAWDDDIHVTKNWLLTEPDGLKKIWTSPDTPQYYPLVFTCLRLEYALWGFNPAGYHWVNLLLHAGSAVLVWRVLRRLELPGAWLAAAIFAVHPVNVESVAWISQIKNTLCMPFYLLSIVCYLRSESGVQSSKFKVQSSEFKVQSSKFQVPGSVLWYWLSVLSFVLALLSKTAVAALPIVLLALAWWRRGRVTLADLRRSAPFFVAALLLGLLTIWFERQRNAAPGIMRADSFWVQLAGAGCAVWFYLYKAVLPLRLDFIYHRWQINPLNPLSYLPGLLLVALAALSWRYRQTWGRWGLFGLVYFIAMLLPVLGFMNVGYLSYSLVADHWQYFAIIAPIALIAAGLSSKFQVQSSKFKVQSSGSREGSRNEPLSTFNFQFSIFTKVLPAAALLLALSWLTWRQSSWYVEAERLWRFTLERNPSAWIAHHQLGAVLHAKGKLEEAIIHYTAALEAQPAFALAHSNLGLVLSEQRRTEEAEAQFAEALRLNPRLAGPHYLLGGLLDWQGKTDEAAAHYETALRLQPDFPEAANDLGCVFAARNRWDEAAELFAKAVRLKPDYAEAHNNLGSARMSQGEMAAAANEFAAALRLKPNYADARCNLGKALMYQKNSAAAAEHFVATLQLKPDSIEALNLLARIRATSQDPRLRDGAEAMRLAARADQLTGGNDARVQDAMAAAQAEAGLFSQALQTAEKALAKAKAAGQTNLAQELEERMKAYQSQQPIRE